MAIHVNLETYAGRKVVEFEAEEALPDPAKTAVRIGLTYDSETKDFDEYFAAFIGADGIEKLEALVIGNWTPEEPASSEPVIEALVSSATAMPALRALFIGDITSEENEISWIEQCDVSALWAAFPNLETFGIRGGTSLSLGRIKHAKLRSLTVEAGGLPRSVVREIAAADLPSLEHLEVWLGTDNYGGDSRPEDLAGILDGTRFPRLKTLALRDCEWADELAAAVAKAPILSRVERLDLSLGTLGDAGADALAVSPAVRRLQSLDIHHHFVSEAGVARLAALGVQLNAEDRQTPTRWNGDEERFIAVSE